MCQTVFFSPSFSSSFFFSWFFFLSLFCLFFTYPIEEVFIDGWRGSDRVTHELLRLHNLQTFRSWNRLQLCSVGMKSRVSIFFHFFKWVNLCYKICNDRCHRCRTRFYKFHKISLDSGRGEKKKNSLFSRYNGAWVKVIEAWGFFSIRYWIPM